MEVITPCADPRTEQQMSTLEVSVGYDFFRGSEQQGPSGNDACVSFNQMNCV